MFLQERSDDWKMFRQTNQSVFLWEHCNQFLFKCTECSYRNTHP
jgi:hypothetical protein